MSSHGPVFWISHWKENYTLPAFPAAVCPLLTKTGSVNTPPAGTQYENVSGGQQCVWEKSTNSPQTCFFKSLEWVLIRLIERAPENPSFLNTHNHFSTRCFTFYHSCGFQMCSEFDCYLCARYMNSLVTCQDEHCQWNREVRHVAWRARGGDRVAEPGTAGVTLAGESMAGPL